MFVLTPQRPTITLGLEPAYNVLTSLSVLGSTESNPGISNWLVGLENQLPADIRKRHRLVFSMGMEALANAVPPGLPDFPAFIAALTERKPTRLRDTMLHHILHSVHQRVYAESSNTTPPDAESLLTDPAVFQAYIHAEAPKPIEPAFSQELHALLNDPSGFQNLLVTHLTLMWEQHMCDEWERNQPVLETAVQALGQIDTTGLDTFAAIQTITGRDLRSILIAEEVERIPRIQLVPSLHSGPYTAWFGNEAMLYIVFGARIPAERPSGLTRLDNAELINRMQALADDTRLNILLAIKQHGELSTQQIIEMFRLDKSAASRHLRQLRAVELLTERRDARTKYYQLNTRSVAGLVAALNALF
jgi:DNA-binding transcriptional ArsR family regulator